MESMSMNKLIFIFLLLTFAFGVRAQQTIISGSVPSDPEAEITLFKIDDPVSAHKTVVKTTYVDARGNFQFRVFPEEIEQYVLRVGERNAGIFVEPERVYNIMIPPFPGDKPKKFFVTLNRVDPVFEELPSDDINNLIANFNLRYESFYSENYPEIARSSGSGHKAFKNAQRKNLENTSMITDGDTLRQSAGVDEYYELVLDFEEEIDSLYSKIDKPFFKSYVNYAIGKMKLSAGLQKQPAYEQYLKGEEVLSDHPEYLNFFTAFHGRAFREITQSKEGIGLKSALNNADGREAVLAALDSVYAYTPTADEKDLLIITQVQRVFSEGYYSKNALLALLEDVSKDSGNEHLAEMASHVRTQLAQTMAGYKLESFKLLNAKNEMVTLSDFEGQFVYISFFATWNRSSLRELSMIKNLEKEYGKEITFLSISMDSSYPDYKKFMQSQMDYDWQFLYGAGDKLLQEKMGVYTLPYFIMIDPEGKKMFSYAKMPSEGIEEVFYRIQNGSKKGEKIKFWND
jgi:thiol-disulfide isomerase/thioredoxin